MILPEELTQRVRRLYEQQIKSLYRIVTRQGLDEPVSLAVNNDNYMLHPNGVIVHRRHTGPGAYQPGREMWTVTTPLKLKQFVEELSFDELAEAYQKLYEKASLISVSKVSREGSER